MKSSHTTHSPTTLRKNNNEDSFNTYWLWPVKNNNIAISSQTAFSEYHFFNLAISLYYENWKKCLWHSFTILSCSLEEKEMHPFDVYYDMTLTKTARMPEFVLSLLFPIFLPISIFKKIRIHQWIVHLHQMVLLALRKKWN